MPPLRGRGPGSHRGLIHVALTMTSMFSQADGHPRVPSGQRSAPALRGGVWTGSQCGPHRGHTVTDPRGHLGAWPRIRKVGVGGNAPGAAPGHLPCRPPGSLASPEGGGAAAGTRQPSFLTGWVTAPGRGINWVDQKPPLWSPFTLLPGKAPPPPLLTTTEHQLICLIYMKTCRSLLST